MRILTWEDLKKFCNALPEEDLYKGAIVKFEDKHLTLKSVEKLENDFNYALNIAYVIPKFENIKE